MYRLAAKLLLIWFLATFTIGCTSLHPLQAEHLTGDLAVVRVEVADVPFFPQQTDQCGPASLAAVLSYQGISVIPSQLRPYLYLPEKEGTLQADIVVTARRYGALPYLLKPRLEDLLKEVAAGNPVLVLQNLAFSWWPRWHYAVVIGFDLQRDVIILRSGNESRYVVPIGTFIKTWQRAGQWALVVLPIEKKPATLSALEIIATILPLEKARSDLALEAYRFYSHTHPDQSLYFIAYGNLLLQQHQYDKAITVYKEGLKQTPDDPLLWNNLAWALDESGCPDLAKQALSQGLKLRPGNLQLRKSIQELAFQPIKENVSDNPMDCLKAFDQGNR